MPTVRLPFALFTLVLFFYSCTKNEVAQQASNQRLHKIIYRDGDSSGYRTFKYDVDGKLSVIEDSNAQTHMGRTFVYYNERNKINKLLRKWYYGSLNNLNSQWTDSFVYDNNDRIIGTIQVSPQSTIPNSKIDKTFSYDELGRLTADTGHRTAPGISNLTRFTYDGSDDVVQIEEIKYVGAGANNIIKMKYNLKENPHKQLGTASYFLDWDPSLTLSKHAPLEVIYRDHSRYLSYEYYNNGLTRKISYTSTGLYASPTPETTEFFYE
ncbi:MAG TPA: hypothetical protein VM935_14610 [Chitinophagaceae bacterium]|nr:hypothetical protein [Chitinophagaceae bacterium]